MCSSESNLNLDLSDQEYAQLFTNINEDENFEVKVYPNPATNFLQLSSINGLENTEIKIMDTNGKICLKEEVKSSKKQHYLNLNGLGNGIYLVYIYKDGINQIEKITILH